MTVRPSPSDHESSLPPLRYLALGDSYTIGEAVPANDRWPQQLVERLRDTARPVDDPEIVATTGWTTRDLLTALDDARLEGPYDLVSLLIGVNNEYQGRSLDEYAAEFTDLLSQAVALGGSTGKVFVVSVPDWGVTPHGEGRDREAIALRIDEFNRTARDIVTESGTHWVDVTDLSRRALDRPELVADDGLHPSGPMYTLWAERIFPVVQAILATE